MATVADVVRWIAIESDDYDAAEGSGSKGFGFARASTEDVANGLGISPEEAFKLLKAAKRKKLVDQVEGMRKKLGGHHGRHKSQEVGWALWEVSLDRGRESPDEEIAYRAALKEAHRMSDARVDALHHAKLDRQARREEYERILDYLESEVDRIRARYSTVVRRLEKQADEALPENDMDPNSSLEWIKGEGVDRDGHNLTWWKNKIAKWSKTAYDRPTVFLRIDAYERDGQRARKGQQFNTDELKEAKAAAKEWTLTTGGTARVVAVVEIPYKSDLLFDLGEWKNPASNGYYVWSIDRETQMPVVRSGPFADPDEAIRLAKQRAPAGQIYDEVVTFGGDPQAGDFELVKAFKAWSGEVHYASDLPKVGGRLKEYRPNEYRNAAYYVWVLPSGSNTPLSKEGPYGPYAYTKAHQFARIAATEGIHDRAVSLGRDPESSSFRIDRRYAARSGERLV